MNVDWIMTGFTFVHQKFKKSKWLPREIFFGIVFLLFLLSIGLFSSSLMIKYLLLIHAKTRYFDKQFELAYATKLPMFLHMRAAAEDFCEIMELNINKLGFWICPTQMTIFSFLSLLTL